jgi:hypothetical protein
MDGLHFHLLVHDAAGHSFPHSQQRGKTLAVLHDNHAAFDVKIALDASKNKTDCVFFCLLMPQKSHLIQEKRSRLYFFKGPLCRINDFRLHQTTQPLG